jgi:hypothetical protein
MDPWRLLGVNRRPVKSVQRNNFAQVNLSVDTMRIDTVVVLVVHGNSASGENPIVPEASIGLVQSEMQHPTLGQRLAATRPFPGLS